MNAVCVPAVAALALMLAAAQETQPKKIRPPEPGRAWQSEFSPAALDRVGGAASVKISQGTLLFLDWTYQADGELRRLEQNHACGFWPTAATAVKDVVFVGGKSFETGHTVIDRLAFDFGGFPAIPPTIRAERVFDGDVEGQRLFDWMLPMDTAPEVGPRVLCQFRDSEDVGVFDPTARTLTTAVTSASLPALRDPKLVHETYALHERRGALYFLSPGLMSGGRRYVVMFDADRDGALDSWHDCADAQAFTELVGECGVDWK